MGRVLQFLAGFVVGAMLGAGAVLLTTPQSGDDLQASLRQRREFLLAEGRRAAEARRAELEARLADIRAGRAN